MRKKILGILMALFIGTAALFPVPTYAECGGEKFLGLTAWYAHLECDGKEIAQSNFTDDNLPKTVWTIILTVLSDLFYVAGVLAVVLIIVSGIQFIMSAGDPGAAAKAKKSLTVTIVGLVITLLASVIVNTILRIVTGG